MEKDVIAQAVESADSKTSSSLPSIVGGILVTAIAFVIPVALFYRLIFYKTTISFLDGVYLFLTIYLIGATATLMYYRMIVVGDNKIQIDQMSLGQVSLVFGKCFAAFSGILGFTMAATALNPSLIQIFENTAGFAFCQMWGVGKLLKKMVTSKLFDGISSEMSNKEEEAYFQYDFLLTTWTIDKKDALRETIKSACGGGGKGSAGKQDLRFDFTWNAKTITTADADKLMEFIDLKYYVGHFIWIYIGSLISLLTSIVAVIMK